MQLHILDLLPLEELLKLLFNPVSRGMQEMAQLLIRRRCIAELQAKRQLLRYHAHRARGRNMTIQASQKESELRATEQWLLNLQGQPSLQEVKDSATLLLLRQPD
ncbi:MAG TPA: hypothetical protein VGV38_05225 [Pyrinomonadaceae bacterium]|nr:hypothetical protein [Pyrinomonadaceae bacterium]